MNDIHTYNIERKRNNSNGNTYFLCAPLINSLSSNLLVGYKNAYCLLDVLCYSVTDLSFCQTFTMARVSSSQ